LLTAAPRPCTWSGEDLERIDRPDGTALEYLYDDLSHPGFLTRVTLVGTDASERILAAYEHDAEGNVVATWRGAAAPSDPGAVDQWTLAFDDPETPEEAARQPLDLRPRQPRQPEREAEARPALGLLPGVRPRP
jgi:hypothetical protein